MNIFQRIEKKQILIYRSILIIWLVTWHTTGYNLGNAFNGNEGTFTAPVDGVYSFNLQTRSRGSNSAELQLRVNDRDIKAISFRADNQGRDTLTLSSQIYLNKGNTVRIWMLGYFDAINNFNIAYFEGHLVNKITID